jgi:DNA helicase-2/ATP-dependent DNA helicase PcrA
MDAASKRAADIAARELALQQLLRVASECDGDRARFEDALTITTEADFWDPRADRVSLLTMHAAKGLEFPVVFIIGLEDGVVPLYWSHLDEATKAEERRLFYVGMTRAKDRLFLTRAQQRLWRGRVRELPASAFLNDIEQELVKHQQMPAPRPKVEDRQLKLL